MQIPITSGLSEDDFSGLTEKFGGYVDEISYTPIGQDDDQIAALLNDEIDLIGSAVDPTFFQTLTEAENVEVVKTLRNGYGYITINCGKYPLNFTDFRRAIAFAVDKQKVSDEVWDGFSEPIDSVIPKVNPFSAEAKLGYSYYSANIELGNSFLDASGFIDIDDDGFREAPDGSDFNIVIECAQSSNIAIEVGKIFEEAMLALDIDTESVPTDFYDYLNRLYFHGDYDMAFIGQSFSDFDVDWLAHEYISAYADEPYFNYPNFQNATYDSWSDQLLHSNTYNEVYEAAIEMQKIFAHECPIIFCYENYILHAHRTDTFVGWQNDAQYGVPSWWTNYKAHLKDMSNGTTGGTLRWSKATTSTNYNFMTSQTAYDHDVNQMFWDSMLRRNVDGNLIPWLASDYKVEMHDDNSNVPSGHTRITFDLIQNAVWTDGMPITASDVAFTLNYYRDGAGNPYGGDLGELYNVVAVSSYQVVIEFSSESYWHLTTVGLKPIIPKHDFEFIGAENWDSWSLSDVATSGPYKLKSSGSTVVLEYNPLYFYPRIMLDPDSIVIESHDDITYTEGSTGNMINWTIEHEQSIIYEVIRNDTLVDAGNLDEDYLLVNVDGLTIGTYNYTLIAVDMYGGFDYDFVTVTVVPAPEGFQLDIQTISILVTVGAVAAIVVVAVAIFRSRFATSVMEYYS